jgi:hypothetical protein
VSWKIKNGVNESPNLNICNDDKRDFGFAEDYCESPPGAFHCHKMREYEKDSIIDVFGVIDNRFEVIGTGDGVKDESSVRCYDDDKSWIRGSSESQDDIGHLAKL